MFLNTGHCTAIKLKNHSIKLKLVSIITWINWTFPEIVYTGPLNSARCLHGSPKVISPAGNVVKSFNTEMQTAHSSHRTYSLPPPPRSLLILIATQVVYFSECGRVSYTFLFTFPPFIYLYKYVDMKKGNATAEPLPQQTNILHRT